MRFIGILAAELVLIVGGLFIVMPHTIQGYYMETWEAGGRSPIYCVEADRPWAWDEDTFCSTDPGQTIQVYQHLMGIAPPQHATLPAPDVEYQ